MNPELDQILPPEPHSAPIPLWVWLLVVALGAVSVYAGYQALSARQLYHEGEAVRNDLAQQRDRLKANVGDLTRQVEQANRSRSEVENALKQSRANTEAASAQIADLQKQVGDLQQKSGDLERARFSSSGRQGCRGSKGRQGSGGQGSRQPQDATRGGTEEAQPGPRRPQEGARAGEPRAHGSATGSSRSQAIDAARL
jgi:hypothetical protein